MRSAALITTLAVAVALSGCGGFSKYSRSKACGVPTGDVSAVVGTDRFHTTTRGETIPPVTGTSFTCSVNLLDRDGVLTVTAERLAGDVLARYREQIVDADEQFTVAGGPAGIEVTDSGFTGRWMCEQQGRAGAMRIHVRADTKASAAERRALVTAVAERAGAACAA
jgi:hypothetical protein